jgi:hypothetical protein
MLSASIGPSARCGPAPSASPSIPRRQGQAPGPMRNGDVERQLDSVARAEHHLCPRRGGNSGRGPGGTGALTRRPRALIVVSEIRLLRGGLIGVESRLDADCACPLGEPGRGPGQEGVWRVCSGLSAAGGGVAKATQLPLGVTVRYSSRADLGRSFGSCCGSMMSMRHVTARSAGLKPTLLRTSRRAGTPTA